MTYKYYNIFKKISNYILEHIKNKYNKTIDNKQIIKVIKDNIKKSGICKFDNCNIQASFGKPGSKIKEYCGHHKLINYINVVSKRCIYEGCNKQPVYGKVNSKLAEYCFEHKPSDYVNIKDKKCIYENCDKIPTYGKVGSKLAEYCSKHKPTDYVNVKHKTCIYKDCNKQPVYGKINSKVTEYCFEHKLIDYVDVKHKTCIYENCNTRPNYGKLNSKLAEYCVEHKPVDYVDIKNKKCIYEGCNKQPIYGKINSKVGEYCVEHKLTDYVNIKDKTCIYEGCNIRPNYGKPGSKLAEYCITHKLSDYINITSKNCIIDNCSSRVRYGKLFCDKIHCGKHKQPNEYRKNNPKCINCKNKPIYTNANNNYPLRCEDHKLNDDIDVISSICSSCKLTDYIKIGNLCNNCSEFEVVRKAQENIIKQLLDDNNIIYTTYDKIIKDGCSTKRPDFTFDLGDRIIVLEVDENQHSSYPVECETNRMIQIHQDYGGLDVCFIRYNPDTYKDKNNKTIKSNNNKHKTLLNTLNSLMIHKPQYNLSAIYLYYDGYDNINKIIEIKTI